MTWNPDCFNDPEAIESQRILTQKTSGDWKGVMNEVQEERKRQDSKWGGPAHDDHHNPGYWAWLTERYSHEALDDWRDRGPEAYRRKMVQVAALAVAAVETFDRNRAGLPS